jgi:hypothetical protein
VRTVRSASLRSSVYCGTSSGFAHLSAAVVQPLPPLPYGDLRPVGRSGRNSVSVGWRADEGSGTRATGCRLDMRHCAHWHLFRSVQNIPHDGIGEPHRPDQAAVSLPASLCIVAHKSTHSRTHIRVRTTRARTELSSSCAESTLGLDRVQPRDIADSFQVHRRGAMVRQLAEDGRTAQAIIARRSAKRDN